MKALVLEARQKVYAEIQQSCSMMLALDTPQSIELNHIETKVNILEKINRRRLSAVTNLLPTFTTNEWEVSLNNSLHQTPLPGLEVVKKYPKLIVFGESGIGKTTFLQHVAIQCSSGQLQANLVPLFVHLREFAATEQQLSLKKYISCKLETAKIADGCVTEKLLNQGKMLILLDGIDEVKETDRQQILQEVYNFTTQFYTNRFIIACRNLPREYTFEQFVETEVAQFDQEQIDRFVTQWFADKNPLIGDRFIYKLSENNSIQELASNPLLLTLLCLVFEDLGELPVNGAEIYQEGLSIWLKKWRTKHATERKHVYKKLSVQHKEDLLSQIALLTFEQGDFFFQQTEVERYIADYICNLPGVSTESEALQLDSKAVLQAIAAQHGLLVERQRGIYSFSHLKIHEYFTAREIVTSSDPVALDAALNKLVSHMTERRWHQVFLLAVSMLRHPRYMLCLMQQEINQLLAPQDQQLQAFLNWLEQKSCTVAVPDKAVVIRAFYFDLALTRVLAVMDSTFNLATVLDHQFMVEQEPTLALDLVLEQALTLEKWVGLIFYPQYTLNHLLERAIAYAHNLQPPLEQALQQLKAQLPELGTEQHRFQQWWQIDGRAWSEQLRAVMIQHRQIGYDWQFNAQQIAALKQYYNANQLLLDCMNNNCYVTKAMRSQIEATLLLPSK